MFYLKRQTPIEAICWTGENKEEIWNHWNYIKFAENLNGEIDGLVPGVNGQTQTLKIGDFLTFGNNGEAIVHKRNDFLFNYEEYTPEVPRVTLTNSITELDKKKIYHISVDIPVEYKSRTEDILNDIKNTLSNLDIKSVVTSDISFNFTELTKKGSYLIETNLPIEQLPELKKNIEGLGVKTILTKIDSVKLTELDLE